MYRCRYNQAPRYLIDHCTPVSHGSYRQRLYVLPAVMHEVSVVPRYWLSTYGRRPLSVAGPTVCNSLPEDKWDPECSVDSYRQWLKSTVPTKMWAPSLTSVQSQTELGLKIRVLNIPLFPSLPLSRLFLLPSSPLLLIPGQNFSSP